MEINHYKNLLQETANSQSKLTDSLWSIMDDMVAELTYKDCIIYLLDYQNHELRQCAAYGPKRTYLNQVLRPLAIPIGKGIVGKVAKSRKPIIVPNTQISNEYIVDIEPGMSEIAVPIIYNNQLIGVIDSESPHIDYYCGRDVSILNELAAITANTLVSRLHQENLSRLVDKSIQPTKSLQNGKSLLVEDSVKIRKSNQEILKKLTKTQIKILYELSKNKTSKQIANSLNIHYRTVQVHRQNICTRLGLKGPNALLHFASRL